MNGTPDILTPKARRTRAGLVGAARVIVGQAGVDGVTVMSVCAEAGVGRTSFYNYFKDVEALVREVAITASVEVRDRFEALHAGRPRGLARLEACFAMLLGLAVNDPDSALLLTSLAARRPEVADLLRSEIAAELEGAGRNDTALTDFLTVAVLALVREIAAGRMSGGAASAQVGLLMKVCQ